MRACHEPSSSAADVNQYMTVVLAAVPQDTGIVDDLRGIPVGREETVRIADVGLESAQAVAADADSIEVHRVLRLAAIDSQLLARHRGMLINLIVAGENSIDTEAQQQRRELSQRQARREVFAVTYARRSAMNA